MLVSLDSNLVDLFEKACHSGEHIDALEALEPPPPFLDLAPELVPEVFACYWILAIAPRWRSTVYTFSDKLYREIARAPRAGNLVRVAVDVLVRDEQDAEHRVPDAGRRPSDESVQALGIGVADAEHVADAVGMSCQYLLTNDRRLRARSPLVEERWGLRIRRPSEYLIEAVRSGAPWTTRAPWPWETIQRMHAATVVSATDAQASPRSP